MKRHMRAAVAVGACAISVAISACGSSPTTATATPAPTGFVAVPSGSTTATPSTSAAGALALTLAELPTDGLMFKQISDGKMNNQPNTDQRGFANAANTYRIEDDVLVDTSSQSAAADYPQLRDATKIQVKTLSSSLTPVGLGSQANEYIGTTSAGYSDIGITFQEGNLIAVLLLENSTGAVDQSFAEAVARAQDQKILAAGI
ncbi:MAG: hypothetical protein QOE18_212 [Chloroflexota bacterium]|jgi:hypothetical protein|nr:hypothetical protein [Chloroflexota bacterium]